MDTGEGGVTNAIDLYMKQAVIISDRLRTRDCPFIAVGCCVHPDVTVSIHTWTSSVGDYSSQSLLLCVLIPADASSRFRRVWVDRPGCSISCLDKAFMVAETQRKALIVRG